LRHDKETLNRYIKEYIRSLAAIEDEMSVYVDQKRDLRNEFRDNGWLNTDQLRTAVKAYRLFKDNFDIDDLVDAYRLLRPTGD